MNSTVCTKEQTAIRKEKTHEHIPGKTFNILNLFHQTDPRSAPSSKKHRPHQKEYESSFARARSLFFFLSFYLLSFLVFRAHYFLGECRFHFLPYNSLQFSVIRIWFILCNSRRLVFAFFSAPYLIRSRSPPLVLHIAKRLCGLSYLPKWSFERMWNKNGAQCNKTKRKRTRTHKR